MFTEKSIFIVLLLFALVAILTNNQIMSSLVKLISTYNQTGSGFNLSLLYQNSKIIWNKNKTLETDLNAFLKDTKFGKIFNQAKRQY